MNPQLLTAIKGTPTSQHLPEKRSVSSGSVFTLMTRENGARGSAEDCKNDATDYMTIRKSNGGGQINASS
jgi:hypothetical protein